MNPTEESLTAARNLLNHQAATMSRGCPDPEYELRSLTAGQVADLVRAHEQSSSSSPYDPIQPFVLAQQPPPPSIESGRIQSRFFALQAKLAQLQSNHAQTQGNRLSLDGFKH